MPTITPGPLVIQVAFDGFESANASGGYGWLGPWQSTGPFVIGGEDPHAGDWQLDLSSGVDLLSTKFVSRMADLAAYDDVHLRFWSRLSRVAIGSQAIIYVSPGIGRDWREAKRFSMVESDGIYHLYDIDLSGFGMSDGSTVGFSAVMDPATDEWRIDDVELVGVAR